MTTGGDEGIRTPAPCLLKAALLQPRYTPSMRNPAEGLQVNLLETPASVAVSATVETELLQSDAGANPPDRVRQKKPMIASPSYPRCARLPPGPKPRRAPFPSFRLLVLHPGETGNPHSPRRRRAIYGIADQSQTTEAMLGERTYDVHFNDRTYWRNVPAAVWDYKLGGYQALKKWLSYRERAVLGRPLTPDEIAHFTNTARRIAAILLLTTASS